MNKDLKEHKKLIKINKKNVEKWQNVLKYKVFRELNYTCYDGIDMILNAIKENSNIPEIFITEFYIKIALKELVKEEIAYIDYCMDNSLKFTGKGYYLKF